MAIKAYPHPPWWAKPSKGGPKPPPLRPNPPLKPPPLRPKGLAWALASGAQLATSVRTTRQTTMANKSEAIYVWSDLTESPPAYTANL